MEHHTIRLVAGEAYRDAITEMLQPTFDVAVDGPLSAGDLCLIEQGAISDHVNALESAVNDDRPAFYPIVMLRQRTPTDNVDLPNPDGPALIDDVVTLPIDTTILQRRLDNLLTRRRYSISLSRYYQQRHERFDGLFDAIAEPALVLDDEGEIVQINDRFAALVGKGRNVILGSSLVSALGTDLEEALLVGDESESASKKSRTIAFSDGNGMQRYAKLSIRMVSLMGEEYAVAILTDITPIHDRLSHLEQRLEKDDAVSTESE